MARVVSIAIYQLRDSYYHLYSFLLRDKDQEKRKVHLLPRGVTGYYAS